MVDVTVAEVPQTNPLNDLLQADRDDAWAYFDRLAGIYARELRRLTRQAEARFHRHQWSAPLTAAGQPADWHIPDPDELIDATKAAGDLAGATRKVREEIAQASVGGTLAAYGLAFDLRNPVIQNVLTQMGQHITSIVEEQRRQIMASLQASWENGLSIRDAAKAMVADSVIDTQRRGELIARTELTGATNGGSLAAVRLVNDASPAETQLRKIWIATNDDRTREAHSEADATYGEGQGIPVGEAFIVDGEELQHPGDPSGSPENVINCRCVPSDTLVECAGTIAAMRRRFEGQVVRIQTASGHDLTATPNHPVLTTTGWVAAGEVEEGSYLVCRENRQRAAATEPHIDNRPTTAEQVFQALALAGTRPDRVGTIDLHGETVDGQVDVVLADDMLAVHDDAMPITNHLRQLSLSLAHREMGATGDDAALNGIGQAQLRRVVSGARRATGLAEDHVDGRADQPGRAADGERGFASIEPLADDSSVLVAPSRPSDGTAHGSRPGSEPGLPEPVLNRADGEADLVADLVIRHPSFVHLDQVTRIDRFPVPPTHVYNLSTTTGCYFAGGIVTANCTIGYEQTGGVAPAPEPVVEAPPAEPGYSTVGGINLPPGLSVSKPFQFGDEQMISLRGPGGVTDSDLHGLRPGEPRHGELGNVSYQERRPRVKGSKGDIHIGTLVVNTAQRGKGYSQDLLRALTDQYPPSEYTYESDLVSAGGESAVRSAVRDDILPPGRFRKTGESYQGHDVVNYRSTKLAPEPVPAPRTPAELSHELIASARTAEPQVTNDLQSIVRANGGTMGGLEFRLKTETSLSGKLARKAAEKGITPEAYSKSVADVLRYTGVFEPADYATGVERTITRLRKAGYKIDDADVENYWSTGDDYNGINMTLRTKSGYRFELQFHTPESMALKNGPLHKLYEQFRDETNAHERMRLWKQMVSLSNSIDQPAEDVLKIGTRTIHKPPELPTTPEDLATSLLDAAKGREPHVTSDLSDLVTANGGKLEGLDFRLKTHDSIVRKLTAKGPLDPVAYSQQIADVLRYTATFPDEKYAQGIEQAINGLRSEGYRIEDSDVENYWESGDDYNGVNVTLTTPGGYRFELQFHTPESFALKNGELHRLYSEFRTSTDPFIRKQLWDQMVELSDALPPLTWEFKETGGYADILRIGKLTRHEPPVAHGVTAVMNAAGSASIDAQTSAYASAMRYTGSGYDDINALLRHGTIGRDGPPIANAEGESAMAEVLRSTLQLLRDQVKDIESLMLPAKKPLMLYRGYKRAVLDPDNTGDLTTLVGKTIEDPGFSSTTAESRTARSFARSGASGSMRDFPDQVVMELAIPKGYPVLNVQRLQGGVGEQEIVLPPGTRYQVQSVRRDEEGRWIVRAIVEER